MYSTHIYLFRFSLLSSADAPKRMNLSPLSAEDSIPKLFPTREFCGQPRTKKPIGAKQTGSTYFPGYSFHDILFLYIQVSCSCYYIIFFEFLPIHHHYWFIYFNPYPAVSSPPLSLAVCGERVPFLLPPLPLCISVYTFSFPFSPSLLHFSCIYFCRRTPTTLRYLLLNYLP